MYVCACVCGCVCVCVYDIHVYFNVYEDPICQIYLDIICVCTYKDI